MNPLELRKILLIGYRFDFNGAVPILDAQGMPTNLHSDKWWGTFAFWLPARKPFRRCAGETKVAAPYAHELQALRDGAITEYLQEFEFPKQPSVEEMRRRLMPVWEALVKQELGFVPNAPPQDRGAGTSIQYTPVLPEPPR